jgi:Na+/H+-dicarboxylate symporter
MTNQLIYGLVTGILFGFFLQRGQVLRYDKQIGALRLMDMTILKFMLTAIFVGSVGIYLLKDLGLVKLSIKSTVLGATIIGGLIFGLRMGSFGILPGYIHGRYR